MPVKAGDSVAVDANVALKAALVSDGFAAWRSLRLEAPTLLWSEAASGASQLRWRGEIDAAEAAAVVDRLLAADIAVTPSAELIGDALAFARSMGWAKTYDAEYVVLAMRRGIPLVTTDARLAVRVRRRVQVLTPTDVDRALSLGR